MSHEKKLSGAFGFNFIPGPYSRTGAKLGGGLEAGPEVVIWNYEMHFSG